MQYTCGSYFQTILFVFLPAPTGKPDLIHKKYSNNILHLFMPMYSFIIIKFSFSPGSIPTDLYPHERILMSLPRPDTASNTAHFTLVNAHYTLCTVIHTVQGILQYLHSTQCTLHTLYTLHTQTQHFKLITAHFTHCILY